MIGMTLDVTTDYLQYLSIALIYAKIYKSDVIPEEVYRDLEEVLTEMNTMCTEKNGYRLSVEVSAM